MSEQQSSGDGKGVSGGLVATVGGLGVLGVFVAQNRESVTFHFLTFDFTWPLWLYTVVVAVFGAIVWLGLGVLRRHRRRRDRRQARRA